MATLPLATAFTDSAVTEGDFKTAITDQREFLAGLLGTDGTANTALRTLGAFGNDVSAKSSNYTVIASDRGVVFNCTSTFTLSLTAASTLGDGFTFAVINTGSGTITIDPNSTELIDGASTKTIEAGAWAIVSCTGTAFISMGAVQSAYLGQNAILFTSSGSWTVPDGVENAIITCVGGGGGGVWRAAGSAGGDGGNGGAAIAYCTGLTGSLSITIGSGGARATTNAGNASSGTSSSVTGTGVSITSTGGSGASNDSRGANGTGSVSTGTAIKTGNTSTTSLNPASFIFGAGNNNTSSSSAVSYSTSSAHIAGAGGGGTLNAVSNTAGSGSNGAVLIQW